MEKRGKEKSVEWNEERKKAFLYTWLWPNDILFKRKAAERGKISGVSQREVLQAPCILLPQTCLSSFQKKS